MNIRNVSNCRFGSVYYKGYSILEDYCFNASKRPQTYLTNVQNAITEIAEKALTTPASSSLAKQLEDRKKTDIIFAYSGNHIFLALSKKLKKGTQDIYTTPNTIDGLRPIQVAFSTRNANFEKIKQKIEKFKTDCKAYLNAKQ